MPKPSKNRKPLKKAHAEAKEEMKISKLPTLERAVGHMLRTVRSAPLVVSGDEKGRITVERPLVGMRDTVSRALGGKPYRTRITQLASATNSGSGTAFSAVTNANMATAPDWTLFAALFDEVKCHSVACRLWARVASNDAAAIIVWDADDNTALGSVASGCSYAKRAGPELVWSPTSTSALVGYRYPSMVVHSGKLSGEGFPDESSGTPVAYPVRGAWVATTASTAIVGFFKPYLEAVSAQTWSVRIYLQYDVSYRLRN